MKMAVNRQRRRTRGLQRPMMMLVAIVGVLWPYMFSIAGSETTFTLTNKTHYFLHAKINNESFVYIAPGGSAIAKVNAPTSVFATALYSPGQAVKGMAEKTVDVQATTSYSEGTASCSNSHEGSTCSSTEPSSSTTATPGRWDVLPSDITNE